MHDLHALGVSIADPEGWRGTVLATDDWRNAAAFTGRNRTISMHWTQPQPGITSTEVLLTLVELLDRHGFTSDERRDVLTHVRTSSSRG